MLNLESLAQRCSLAQHAYRTGEPAAEILREEAQAFLTQAVDAGVVTEESAAHLQQELNHLLPHGSAGDDELQAHYDQYRRIYRTITSVHTRKSLEWALQTEPAREKRQSIYENFLRASDNNEAQELILKILRRRGPGFTAPRGDLLVQDVAEVNGVLHHVAATLGSSLQAPPSWEAYSGLQVHAQAPVRDFVTICFELVKQMFDVEVRPNHQRSYHSDVEVFEVTDAVGRVLGHWHVDLFRRPRKYQGAWTQTALGRRALPDGSLQIPLVFLGFDLDGDNISFSAARSFLHELGHALEHTLSAAPRHTRDTNEISSTFLESHLTHPQVLSVFNAPAEELRARRAQQRQLDLAQICLWSKIDLELHHQAPQTVAQLKQIVVESKQALKLDHPLVTPETVTTFDHAFADGEYAATYYSYLLSYVFARQLSEQRGTEAFVRFWHQSAYAFAKNTRWTDIRTTNLLEDLC